MDTIEQLDQWRYGPARAQITRQLAGWAAATPALTRFTTAEELFSFLGSEPSSERDAVFCALLSWARVDRLAGEVVLSALLPGLKQLAGRLLHSLDDRDEIWSLLLAAVWEQISGYPIRRRPRRVAANLLLDTRKHALAELDALGRQGRLPGAWEALAGTGLSGSVDLLLDRAVAAGAVGRRDADLILTTRIDGRPLAEIAGELGVAYQALLMRRIRAEKRLLLYLGRPVVSFRGRNRHICSARPAAPEAADSASGGAST